MSKHQVNVDDGAEYPGETYIRCKCGTLFGDAHQGLAALIAFLRKHKAIP